MLTSHFKNEQKSFLNIKPISHILGTTSGSNFPIINPRHYCILESTRQFNIRIIKVRFTWFDCNSILAQFEVFDRGLCPPDGLDNVLSAMFSCYKLMICSVSYENCSHVN